MFNWGGGGGGGEQVPNLEVYKLDRRKKIIAVIDTTFAVGFLFTTAKVVSIITAMIFFLSNSYFRSSLNI